MTDQENKNNIENGKGKQKRRGVNTILLLIYVRVCCACLDYNKKSSAQDNTYI